MADTAQPLNPKYPEPFKAEIVSKALRHIEGGNSLQSFCNVHNLNRTTVLEWIIAKDGDGSTLRRARVVGTQALADDCLEITKGMNGSDYQVENKRFEQLLRLAGKWNRADYGDNVQIDAHVTKTLNLEGVSAQTLIELGDKLKGLGFDVPTLSGPVIEHKESEE